MSSARMIRDDIGNLIFLPRICQRERVLSRYLCKCLLDLRRRLLFAGVKDDEWFIHYERGGGGHGYSVIAFKVDAQQRLQFLWGGVRFRGAKNLDELRKMVAAGQFSDDVASSW
jgi:hypothetical protein